MKIFSSKAPTMKMRKVAELIPYANNSRTHSEAQVRKIADSIQEFGFLNPVICDQDNGVIAGHGRLMAADLLGIEEVPTVEASHLTEEQKRAYIIADNKLALDAGWDNEILRAELEQLRELDFDIELTGFTEEDLKKLTPKLVEGGNIPDDEVPLLNAKIVTEPGDLWTLGNHRLLCGDSLSVDAVEKLTGGAILSCIHADPPYGLGKESEGVKNDNLYREKLDDFQQEWFTTWLPNADPRGSVYIWGYPLDLWRFWHSRLAPSFDVMFKNNIVWNKRSIAGKKSEALTKYPIATEHCLFFVLGFQHFGNINTENFFEGWEPVRAYLEGEANAVKLKPKKCQELCGVQMYSHWFSKCQWTLIPEKYYAILGEAFPGRFLKPWPELKQETDAAQAKYRELVDESRAFFDNTHESMWDVWDCYPVTGDERYGHATPKPVEIIQRIMLSSVPPGGTVGEPFGGTGTTLIAAEKTGRVCYMMELEPAYCDVVISRWQAYTGQEAVHENGKTFKELQAEKHGEHSA